MLIVAGIVLVLCCGGAIAGGIVLFNRVSDAVQPVRDGADAFLADMAAGRYDAAYGRLCESARAETGRAEFASGESARPLTSYDITAVNVSNVNGQVSGSITAELTYGGTSQRRSIQMVAEDGEWKVCGHPY